ncbi:SDR family NAD(P)-dependent oxidoreductase [Streptomyces sp. NPDC054833]
MEDTGVDEAQYQFEVNLFGLARLTQLVLPYMRKQGAGRLVNVSSIGGKIYTPLGSWYHATKHVLEGWSDCLRLEVAPFGIDVVIIEPGVIDTEFGDVMVGPMLERSGCSAYGELAHRLAASSRENHRPGSATSASRLADVIVGSITARRPKTRYVAGKWHRSGDGGPARGPGRTRRPVIRMPSSPGHACHQRKLPRPVPRTGSWAGDAAGPLRRRPGDYFRYGPSVPILPGAALTPPTSRT